MFITNNHTFFHLPSKIKFGKVTNILKILCPWLHAKFSFAFYIFAYSSNFKNNPILAGVCFIYLKNVLEQTGKTFDVEFGPQLIDRDKYCLKNQVWRAWNKLD